MLQFLPTTLHPDADAFRLVDQGPSLRLWLRKDLDGDTARSLAESVRNGDAPADTVFKNDSFHLVYRPAQAAGALVKCFRLPRLKDRLRPWRFAQAEMDAHLLAEARGVPCPRLLGCFEQRAAWWCPFPRRNGIVMEFLEGWHEAGEQDVPAVVAMLKKLYECGVNHADFMCKNVMVKDGTTTEGRMIDLEGCSAIPQHHLGALLMQTQRYIEFNERGIDAELNQDFIKAAAGIVPHIPVDRFSAAVRLLLERHRSRLERRRLILPPQCFQILNQNPY